MAGYVIGLDIGQAQDPSAIAIVRHVTRFATPDEATPRAWIDDGTEFYECGYLDRLPLGATYSAIVAHVKSLKEKLPPETELCIDVTGVGKPVAEMFEAAGLEPVGVLITGGNVETSAGRFFNIPKLHLIAGMQSLLSEKRFKVVESLPEAEAFCRELQDFRVDFTESGAIKFGAKSGRHDDLVIAASLATWRLKTTAITAIPVLAYYRSRAKAKVKAEGDGFRRRGPLDDDDEKPRLPWHAAPKIKEIKDDAEDLNKVYWDAYNGVAMPDTDLCAACQRPLTNDRHTDGVLRWCATCPPPGSKAVVACEIRCALDDEIETERQIRRWFGSLKGDSKYEITVTRDALASVFLIRCDLRSVAGALATAWGGQLL